MTQVFQSREEHHLTDLMHDAVWVADERSSLDAAHVAELHRVGFGWKPDRIASLPN